MKVWIPRPEPDASTTAQALIRAGFNPVVAPVMQFVPADDAPDILADRTGIIFTSSNGARAASRLLPNLKLPTAVVGSVTAQTARELGYPISLVADGNAIDLVDKLYALPHERWLHVRGRDATGDVAEQLQLAGISVQACELYAMEAVDELSPELRAALTAGEIAAVLVFSVRTARLIKALTSAATGGIPMGGVRAICASSAIAAEFDGSSVRVAASLDDMICALEAP